MSGLEVLRQTTGRVLRSSFRRAGYDVVRHDEEALPFGIDEATRRIIRAVRPFTLTSPERVNALCGAIGYVQTNAIPGAVVECGVWRGGSMMAAALAIQEHGVSDRELWLFDTYEGMSSPSEVDVRAWDGCSAATMLQQRGPSDPGNIWCVASIEDVRANLSSTGYPSDRVHCIAGKVEETLPGEAPSTIAVLRLDTDWYSSTLQELEQLYHRISPGGVLILDDYGEWQGARRATDEFLLGVSPKPLLVRVDVAARIAVIPRTTV